MHRIICRIKIWNKWRIYSLNSKWYKFLVLIGAVQSPTLNAYYFDYGFRAGLKESEDK